MNMRKRRKKNFPFENFTQFLYVLLICVVCMPDCHAHIFMPTITSTCSLVSRATPFTTRLVKGVARETTCSLRLR